MGTIKSFKKFIEESIWSDMQDRSTGETVRKEDDINNLDLDEFYTYIKNRYKIKVKYIDLRAIGSGIGVVLGVNITEDIVLFYEPKRGHILLSWIETKIPMSFFDELEDRFKIENPSTMRRIITEKDGSCTNKTFVNTIEFFLGHKESMMNESIWSDMQDRSTGETVRKEDERQKILERLLATYIKLFAESCYYHDEYEYCSYPDFRSYIKDFRDNPRIEEVCPNNSYFDDLLDYVNEETWDNQIYDIIEEISQRIVHGEHLITDDVIEELRKHNVNESIWSDMQDRSTGEVIRKEDDVNILDYDDLYDYIKSKYSGKLYYIDKDHFGKGGETMYVDPIENVSLYLKRLKDGSLEHILLSWVRVDIDHSFLLKLEERFFVSSPNVKRRIIKEKDGTCTNQTYIDVIDFFLAYIDNIAVNESIWSDMQDRSMGKTVRKEDEYDIDEKELEGNVDTCIKTYVIMSVYYDKYDGSSDTFLKCIQEWDRGICGNAKLYDRRFGKYVESIKVIPSYIKENWETGKSYKSLVDKRISEEEKKVKDTGFIKKPGESINDTLSQWFNKNFEKLGQDFCEEIEEYNDEYHREGGTRYIDLGVEEWWDDLKYIEQIEIYQKYIKNTNESIWSDMQGRSMGDTVRKEDEMNDDDFLMLNEVAKMFKNVSKRSGYTSQRNSCDSFIKYIEKRKEEHFWNDTPNETYDKIIRFVQKNWGDCTGIQEFIDKYLSNINECDGVPGGLTPADVGGMGPAYFPGPNGEPGSGDLPSPTGIVYKQVAPFDSFIKIRKQKKKKKKFRKEDEPCAHSENPPIYSHVDDFRDYVDRTYDKIDKKK